MIPSLLLCLGPVLVPAAAPAPSLAAFVQDDPEVAKRLADAGQDVAKLLDVAHWCEQNDKAADAREVYKKVLEVDAENEEAHKALRHHFYDGHWFESYVALSKYKREEADRMKEKGYARVDDQWVALADVPFVRMGWVKQDDGTWRSKLDAERDEQVAKWKADGFTFRPEDMSWVAPDDADKVKQGLWKCGDQWLPMDQANAWHAVLGQWWRYQDANTHHFTVLSTCDHGADPRQSDVAWAAWYADQAWDDLQRALGVTPKASPQVVVLRSTAQYNTFAGGDQATGQPGTDSTGASSLHYAYFADNWFDASVTPPQYEGAGVCYWDTSDPKLKPYGGYAVRNAAAQSYMEAVDPSWETVSNATGGSQPMAAEAFWGEKRIPIWFRFGLAFYCDRFYKEPGSENPWATREWALSNLRNLGDLLPLQSVFTFQIDPVNDPATSSKLLFESGLVVSFVLDGGQADVTQAHEAFKAALKSGGDTSKAVADLQKAILAHEGDVQAFAKL